MLFMLRKDRGRCEKYEGEKDNSHFSPLIKQILDGEHDLIGGCGVHEVLGGIEMELTVNDVVGVLSFLIGEQTGTRNLLEYAPVLTEEIRQVEDVKTKL